MSVDKIEQCVNHVRSLINKYEETNRRLTESDTIRVMVTPMLESMGWDKSDVDDFRSEYRHTSGDNPVDCALFISGKPVLFVESKPLGADLAERKWISQTINYANTAGVQWCVLTNGAEWRVYKTHHEADVEDKLFKVLDLRDGQAAREIAEFLHLLGRANMGMRSIDELWNQERGDALVRDVLDVIVEDPSFVRLIHKRVGRERMTEGAVRDALRKCSLRFVFPGTGVRAPGEPSITPDKPRDAGPCETPKPPRTLQKPHAAIKTAQMFEAGVLRRGMRLRVLTAPDRPAEVLDGKRVLFEGEAMTYSQWGMRVTGWSAIRIYIWAVDDDGVKLDELRARMMAANPRAAGSSGAAV